MIHARSLHTAQKVTTYVWAEDESAAGMQLLWQYRQNKQDLLKAAVADGCASRLHLLIMFVSVKLRLLKVQPRLCGIKVTVLLHNLISPCLVPAAHLTSQMQVVQHVLAEDARNMGLVLLPVFSHKKNGRYAEEELIMKELGKIGCNLDHSFSVIFADRTDSWLLRFLCCDYDTWQDRSKSM